MSLLLLALAAAPQALTPTPPADVQPSFHPTTVVRTGAGPIDRGSCSPLTNGGFHNDLYAWEFTASAASSQIGTAEVVAGACEIRENGSFLSTLAQSLCVPADATALSFDLVSTSFDQTAGGFPDAFEVSLLDSTLQSVVPTWSPGATSFFNVQEDGSYLLPGSVTADPAPGVLAHVTLDLTALAPGLSTATDLRLYFDLVGADSDSAGSVTIDDIVFERDVPGVVYCEGIGCPCGNDMPGTGCANSTGAGGLLLASGSASLSNADLTLEASGLPQNFAVFILAADETCVQIGDGIMAVQPGLFQTGILRGSIQHVDPAGLVSLGPDAIGTIESNMGMPGLVTAGSTWFFQVAYRDVPVSPCGTQFNLTNGLRITFAD